MSGPLAGVRVVELAGLAPGPFACMVLADLGADVLRVQRPGDSAPLTDVLGRGRATVELDLKTEVGVAAALALTERADVLVEGYRPGVAERLGIGPDACLERNPQLVYGRLTGWGQTGPRAKTVGHDINYLALSGALSAIGRAGQPPSVPLNLVADFGGGGMLLVVGVLAALLERSSSGRGQVVDAAMVDGVALLTTFLHGLRAAGAWRDERGTNLLDGGAPFYDVYATADGGHVAVGALEPEFYAELLEGLGLATSSVPSREDPSGWPQLRALLASAFATRTRDEWVETFAGTDACVTPVLGPGEAPRDPHAVAREAFVDLDDVVQPAAAPRFSRTPGAAGRSPHAVDVLRRWGLPDDLVPPTPRDQARRPPNPR